MSNNTNEIKPDYYGNIIYESSMGLYWTEKEAQKESWMGEQFFPLYTKETLDKKDTEITLLKEELNLCREIVRKINYHGNFKFPDNIGELAIKHLARFNQIKKGSDL